MNVKKQVSAAGSATTVAAAASTNGTPQQNNLFISVKTFENTEGRCIGERIVDLYHFGTRSWLQNHQWWAMHNGHSVEVNVATDKEVADYLASGKAALAEKFNGSAPAEAEKAAA